MPPSRRILKKLAKLVEQEAVRQGQLGRQLRLMFQDEARFGRISDPRRCWAPKGFRPAVGMQIVREYTYAFRAVSPHDGTLDSLVLPVVTAEAMSIFLGEVARRHPEEFILMFLDGAGWHRANDLKVPTNMRLEALPPYSPQLNPVEHIWEEIREKWFANEVFNSLDAVEDRLVEALVALENDQELVASTTGFDWIINCH
jgi:putative transposase